MFVSKDRELERQRHLSHLENRMRSLHNEMEFVEILAQFWPWPNMALKVERLQMEIDRLRLQSRQLSLTQAG